MGEAILLTGPAPPPPPGTKPEPKAALPYYLKATKFAGAKAGYYFATASRGTGYYRDAAQLGPQDDRWMKDASELIGGDRILSGTATAPMLLEAARVRRLALTQGGTAGPDGTEKKRTSRPQPHLLEWPIEAHEQPLRRALYRDALSSTAARKTLSWLRELTETIYNEVGFKSSWTLPLDTNHVAQVALGVGEVSDFLTHLGFEEVETEAGPALRRTAYGLDPKVVKRATDLLDRLHRDGWVLTQVSEAVKAAGLPAGPDGQGVYPKPAGMFYGDADDVDVMADELRDVFKMVVAHSEGVKWHEFDRKFNVRVDHGLRQEEEVNMASWFTGIGIHELYVAIRFVHDDDTAVKRVNLLTVDPIGVSPLLEQYCDRNPAYNLLEHSATVEHFDSVVREHVKQGKLSFVLAINGMTYYEHVLRANALRAKAWEDICAESAARVKSNRAEDATLSLARASARASGGAIAAARMKRTGGAPEDPNDPSAALLGTLCTKLTVSMHTQFMWQMDALIKLAVWNGGPKHALPGMGPEAKGVDYFEISTQHENPRWVHHQLWRERAEEVYHRYPYPTLPHAYRVALEPAAAAPAWHEFPIGWRPLVEASLHEINRQADRGHNIKYEDKWLGEWRSLEKQNVMALVWNEVNSQVWRRVEALIEWAPQLFLWEGRTSGAGVVDHFTGTLPNWRELNV